MDFCFFVTYGSLGHFYLGKGRTSKVRSGRYKGSGSKLLRWFKVFPKNLWTCEIVQEDLTEQEAYDLEASYIDEDVLADPKCLNLRAGGRTAAFYSAESKRRMSLAKIGKKQMPEGNEKRRLTLLGRMTNPRSPELAKAMGSANKDRKHSVEAKANMGASRLGKKRGPYKTKGFLSEAQLEQHREMALKCLGKKRGPYKKKSALH